VLPGIAFLFVVIMSLSATALADQLRLTDGTTMEVDEAWEDAQGVWYRRGGVTYLVERSRVREVLKPARAADVTKATHAGDVTKAARSGDVRKGAGALAKEASDVSVLKPMGDDNTPKAEEVKTEEAQAGEVQAVWIYLVGGAKMEVDEASESADGIWFKRGNISTFIERERIDHVERERLAPGDVAAAGVGKGARRERRWTTGSARLDSIIRQNGARYGVDPYLVFCVMEQESHFNSRAVSPVGARGLMQLMPGTAARFGVRNSHDPAQSVAGGTRYLKELLRRFNGRVELVLAGYNAGEGNVMRFGYRVPPFRETRNYVRRVGARYTRGE
jgi:Zn-finger nucleic acid-binding protein